jgi:aspartate/methionine/tyrosine aminotransferase
VLISDPSWENHRALFTNAGFEVETYPYYDAATRGVRFDAMLAALQRAGRHHRRAARLLPQPHRLRPHARAVGARWSRW